MDIAQNLNIKIRRLNEDHLMQLVEFHKNEQLLILEEDKKYKISTESFQSYLQLNQYKVFTAFDFKNLMCGYIIFLASNEEADIVYLYVKQNYRNQGVASSLINVSRETFFWGASIQKQSESFEIHEGGEKKVVFLEVACNNIAAINLYKKLNFNIVSVRKGYSVD